tara:strand:- start:1822 stop:3954 length:2133 start_codon:yes stop_codon:yes gene_type:complete
VIDTRRLRQLIRTIVPLGVTISIASAQAPTSTPTAAAGATVTTDPAASQKLRLARAYLAQENWSDAISLLRRTLDDHADDLVESAPGRFQSTSLIINQLLVRLPPAGLAVYRAQVDAQARRWWETGRSQSDRAQVQRVLDRAYASRFGDDALWWLGEQAWHADQPQLALEYWRQLISADSNGPQHDLRYPDSQFSEPTVRTRIVLCHLLAGDQSEARREWAVLKRQFPAAEGLVGGEQGVLVELLQKWLTRPTAWHRPGASFTHETLGGTTDRNGRGQPTALPIDPGAPIWHAGFSTHNPPPAALQTGGQTDLHPAVLGDLLFAADAFRIHAWDLRTGHPAWSKSGRQHTSTQLYPPPPSGSPVRAARPLSARVVTSLHVDQGRLLARVGSPVTGQAEQEPRPLDHEIVILDITHQEGRLLMHISPRAIPVDSPQTTWSFDGSPLANGNLLFVATRRGHQQVEVGLACFDISSGQLVWHRPLAAAMPLADRSTNVVTHNLLAQTGDSLFYAGDTGVVARVDVRHGSIDWITLLERPNNTGPFLPLVDINSHRILARSSNDTVVALHAGNGTPAWRQQLNGPVRHLLAVRGRYAIVSGYSLYCIDMMSGDIAWQRIARRKRHRGQGRGLVVGETVCFPTTDRLHLFDLRTGQPTRQPVRLDERNCQGGNLALSDHGLLVFSHNRVTLLGHLGGRRDASGNQPEFDTTPPTR